MDMARMKMEQEQQIIVDILRMIILFVERERLLCQVVFTRVM